MQNTLTGEGLQVPQARPSHEIIISPEDGSVVAFPLSALTNGDSKLHGVNFQTEDGNMLTVVNRGRHTGNPEDDGKIYVLNRDKGGDSQFIARRLDEETVLGGLINVGESVSFGDSDVVVTGISPIYSEKEDSPETKKPEREYQISNNDEKLVRMMLYPDRGPWRLYEKLVESTSDREGWTDPEAQRKAQRGIRRLFEVAMYPHEIPEGGIVEARKELASLQKDEEKKEKLDWLRAHGIRMEYQSPYEYKLNHGGDFLHFGIGYSYATEPDVLDSMMRVYVTPKKDSIGFVAAAVVARARANNYMPWGKVWDDTTAEHETDDRADRMLFYVRTQSQLDLILDSLREVQANHPEAFESDPPLLADRTDIPGVGLGEEPRRGDKYSYNQMREGVIDEAWDKTLEEFANPKPADPTNDDFHIGDGGMVIEMRHHKLRQHADKDPELMGRIIKVFRKNVRELSPKYDISPDNFSRNLVV